MGAVKDALFGSKGTPSQIVDTTPGEFAGLRGPIADALKNLISSGGGPSFTGVPTVASGNNPFASPMGANEQVLLDQLMANNPAANASTGAARDLIGDTISGKFLPGQPGANPFLSAAIDAEQRRVTQNFTENVIPQLRTSFTRAGQFIQPGSSSPFEMAAARASGGLADALGDIGTKMSSTNFEAERGRQQQAATIAPQIEQADVDRTVSTLQAQALPRLIEQMGIDKGLAEFQRRIDTLLQALGAGGQLSQAQSAVMPGTAATPGLVQGVAGAAGQGFGQLAGMAGALAMFSDRRLKENIDQIGTLRISGIPVYEFNFIGETKRSRGFMADEVEKVMPQAVGEQNGYKTVDYAMVLRREVN